MKTRPVDATKDILVPVLLAFIVFFVGLVCSVGAYSFSRNYETQYFPIIKDYTMTDTRVVDDRLLFKPRFNKVRDCQLMDQSWYVRLPDQSIRQVYIGLPGQKPGNLSGPVGVQTRTDVEVGQLEWPDAIHQYGYMYHDCFGYTVRTKVGPFPIFR